MTPRMRSGAMDCGGSLQQGKRPRMVCGSRPSSWRLQTSTFAGGCCRRKFQLHLCIGPSRDCTKTKRKPSFEFHTDFFRLLDTGDLCGKVLPWTKLEPAKRDLEDELAKLQGEAEGQTGLGWTASDDDEDDGEEADVSEVKKMLAALKASVAKGDPGGGAGGDARNKSEKAPKKKKKDKSRKGRKSQRKRQARCESSGSAPPRWFGPPRPSKRSRPSTGSSSSSSERSRDHYQHSEEGSKGKKAKKKKRSALADRGPYGAGAKQRYDGKDTSSRSGDSDGEEGEQVFRAGLSTRSQHFQLKAG